MKVGTMIKALNEAKQQRPEFDYAHLVIKINGEDVENANLNLENFSINLTTKVEGEIEADATV